MRGAVERADEIAEELEGAFVPGQFDNPANPRAHYETTGPELEAAAQGEAIGALVAGVGTGGTISGAGRYLKERDASALAIAVEPAESPIIAQTLRGEAPMPSPHPIQGIGANFIPATLDLDVLDGVEHVSGDEAIAMARRLAAEEGLFVGISSGANVVAALRVAGRPEMDGRLIFTVAPSTGERYLSTPLWEGLA
jgi:cysteine synthase A